MARNSQSPPARTPTTAERWDRYRRVKPDAVGDDLWTPA